MKRTQLQRKSSLGPGRRRPPAVRSTTSSPGDFYAAARAQRACLVCGSGGDFHAHHIVDKQLLRRERQLQHDPRNALRLCTSCHMSHEWAGPGKVEIELAKLPLAGICYAFEVLGRGPATVYLRRHYAGEDERVNDHLLERGCELCR